MLNEVVINLLKIFKIPFADILTLFLFFDKQFSYKFNHDLLHAETTSQIQSYMKGYII